MSALLETERLHIGKSGELEAEFIESEALERYEQLALEAIELSRRSIMMAARYLNAALWHLPPERAVLPRPLATDGRALRFDPERVVSRYRESDSELVRDCLHAVLHCVFHHPFEKRYGEHAAFSLASDVAVELCAIQLAGQRFPSKRDEERLAAGERLAALAEATRTPQAPDATSHMTKRDSPLSSQDGTARTLTAPALYRLFRCGAPGEALYREHGLDDAELSALRGLFQRDSHELWAGFPRAGDPPATAHKAAQPLPDLQARSPEDAGSRSRGERGDDAPDASGQPDEEPPAPDEATADEATEPASSAEQPADELAAEWDKVSKRVEAELRAQRQGRSDAAGLLQNLRVANRKPADYDEFLRRFATVAEDLRVSDEEFDYVYYTYGLSRYGNIPLVEPLEYQESNRVREFVIALDTSGSCSDELIRTFVQRTFDILRSQTSFGDEVNVHLVQCDMRVRTATKVRSLSQLESYADSFWVSGGGGTDFRPVFEYVDGLVEAGEFDDLRGLIYFTDGYGAFPVRAPGYDVAFVFVDDADINVKVPAWAMKVTMTQEEVLQR